MKTRLNTLGQLRALYQVVTHRHGVALEQAASSVQDAEQRIAAQLEMASVSSIAGLTDLQAGDTLGWIVHTSQRQLSEQNAAWLEGARDERLASMHTAADSYRESRVQLEQMQSVIRALRSRLERERVRRDQHDADDRFLSRQRWMDMKRSMLSGETE